MKVFGSLLLLSAATAEAQFGILGDLLGLGSHDAREIEGPSNSNCSYYCSNNGGCVVDYVGPSRPGKTSGSCFPHSYGGECSGTPPECSNCNSVLTCHEPGQREEERGRPPVEAGGDVCDYSCQPSGSCIVKYVGPPRGGNTAGSCFPDSYGGGCSGTPRECEDCNSVLTCHEPGVRNHKVSSPPRRGRSEGDCQYNCEGWPYSQCEMSSSDRFGSAKATCINPYFNRGSTAKFSNYPECATVPRGCQRCDDYCARQQGKRDRFSY